MAIGSVREVPVFGERGKRNPEGRASPKQDNEDLIQGRGSHLASTKGRLERERLV